MEASRRGFLKSASGMLGGVVGLGMFAFAGTNEHPDVFAYKGYKIVWTGWKSEAQSLRLVGQWIAIPYDYKNNSDLFFAVTGGVSGWTRKGFDFDIQPIWPQAWIDINSTEEEKDASKSKALGFLLDLVDKAKK